MLEQIGFMRLMVLVEIIETGGFGCAAERLNLTQPAVSFHVRALERIFGHPLFLDPRRSVELTEAGKLIYEFARSSIQQARTVMRDVQGVAQGEHGRLVFGASTSVGARLVPLAVAAFRNSFPNAQIALRVNSSGQISNLVASGELDAGLILEPAVPPGLESTPTHLEELLFVTEPNHPLQCGSAVTPQAIARVPIVVSPKETVHYRLLSEWFHRQGIHRYTVAAEIQSVDGIVTAVESGLGISALFRSTIHHALRFGSIRILEVTDTPILVAAHLIMRPNRPNNPLLNRFREFLLHWLSTQAVTQPVITGGK